jgi:hypothetical protein
MVRVECLTCSSRSHIGMQYLTGYCALISSFSTRENGVYAVYRKDQEENRCRSTASGLSL